MKFLSVQLGRTTFQKKVFRILFFFLFFFTFSVSLYSANIQSTGDGDWTEASVWDNGVPTINDVVTVDHEVTIPAGTTVEVDALYIASNGKLIVEGTLIIHGNFDMANNYPELVTGSSAQVIIYGSATFSNKVTIDLSSYFVVFGDFLRNGSDNQGSIETTDAHVYVMGTVDSNWDNFTGCDGDYDGTTTAEDAGDSNCDAGGFQDLVDHVDPDDLPPGVYDDLVESSTTDANTLSASSNEICSGGSVDLTISDGSAINISWYKDGEVVENSGTTNPYTINSTGTYYAVYESGGTWYQTNEEVITLDVSPPNVTVGTYTDVVTADGSCMGYVPDLISIAVYSDNCTTPASNWSVITQSPSVGSGLTAGDHQITLTAVDDAGNSEDFFFDFEVQDTTDPSVSCQTNPVWVDPDSGECFHTVTVSTEASLDPSWYGDNCSATLSNNITGTSSLVGQQFYEDDEIVWTIADDAGNSVQCTVVVDIGFWGSNAITFSDCPSADVTADSSDGNPVAVSWTEPTASISGNGCIQSLTSTHNPGDSFPVGTTTVVYTATDGEGNTETCEFDVVVSNLISDTEPPTAICQDITVSLDASGNASITPDQIDDGSTDNVTAQGDLVLSLDISSFTCSEVGNNTVTLTVADEASNSNTCQATVLVEDNTDPVISGCPSDIYLNSYDGNAVAATWSDPSATDNCTLASLTSDYNSGDSFPVGTTQVTYTATDGEGNTSLCQFNVIVTEIITTDTDGDGIIDSTDEDDDNDGITDCAEKGLDGTTVGTSFNISGDASAVSSNEIQLTPEAGTQRGTAMYNNKIDFSSSFSFSFDAYLGDNNGADGIAIIFHNDPSGVNAIGADGEGMGASGIQNGIVLEIDTYQNTNQGDPSGDHGCIWESDNISNRLTTPIEVGELENNSWHSVSVTWNASSSTISYTVNGTLAGQYTGDLANNFFAGNSAVYFGFTAATGGLTNVHSVQFSDFCDLPALVDSDNDGTADALDLDSDNDGCYDVTEAGFTDGDGDGILGSSPVSVNSSGLVTSGTDGYSTPEDIDSNSIFDFQETGPDITISSQPSDVTECAGDGTSFTVTANYNDTYKWQENDGSGWTDIPDVGGDVYSDQATSTLTISDVSGLNGNQYRCVLSRNGCFETNSDDATLTVSDIQVSETLVDEGCPGQNDGSIDITVTGGIEPYSYTWSVVSGSGSVNANDEDQTNLAPGEYQVQITDDNLCSETQNYTISAGTGIVTPEFSGSPSSTACGGNTETYTLTSTYDSYSWSVSGGSVSSGGGSTDNFVTVTWGNGSTGSISVDVTSGGCSDNLTYNVTIVPEPSYTAPENDTICIGGTSTLTIEFDPEEAMYFDGSNDRIDIGNSILINTSTVNNRTISLWFKADGVSSRQVLYEEGGGTHGISIFIDGGEVYVNAWESRVSYGAISSSVSSGTWYHVAFVMDSGDSGGDYIKGYLNGNYMGSATDSRASNGLPGHGGDVNIGVNQGTTRFPISPTGSSYNYYGGYIDEFKLWNRSLSQSDVQAEMYNVHEGSGGDSDLAVYFNFNDDSGNTVTDETGGDNNGTAQNGASHEADTPFTPTISWSPGGMTTASVDVTPTETTTYTYTLTEPTIGCQTTNQVIVTVSNMDYSASSFTNEVCPGASDGTIDLEITGGIEPYSFYWSTPDGSGLVVDAEDQSGLSPGLYDVLITDANGCTETTGFTISEGSDTEDPTVASCPSDINVNVDTGTCGAVVTYTAPAFDDNCDGSGLSGTLAAGLASGSTFPVGTTTVTYEFTDAAGNGPAACSFDVTVTGNEAPRLDCPGSTVSLTSDLNLCTTTYDWEAALSIDACNGYTLGWSRDDGVVLEAEKFNFTVGTTVVDVTVTDDGNGLQTNCQITVFVDENPDEAPTITAPDDVTVSCLAAVPAQEALSYFETNSLVDDNCGYENSSFSVNDVTVNNLDGSQTITRTYSISDYAGNPGSDDQIITVTNDLDINASITITPGCTGELLQITATQTGFTSPTYQWQKDEGSGYSNISGADALVLETSTHNEGDKFRLEATEGACSVYSNELTLTYNDQEKPVFDASLDLNTTVCIPDGQTSTTVTGIGLTNVTQVSDNCTAFGNLVITYVVSGTTTANSPSTGQNDAGDETFNVGTSTVVYTVKDESNNEETYSFDVVVNSNPAIGAITTDGTPPGADGSGYKPYQGAQHTYSVTDEAGFDYTWRVENSGSTDITSSLPNSGQGSADFTITWDEDAMPGNYTVFVVKENQSTGCETETSLSVTVLNGFNLRVQDFGDACHEVTGSTIMDFVVEVGPNPRVAPGWSFDWNLYLNGGGTPIDAGTVNVSGQDNYTVSITVDVGDGSEKNYRFEITNGQDSLGNTDNNSSDNEDLVKIFTKPTIGF